MTEKKINILKPYFKLFKKKECRRLTFSGWLVLFFFISIVFWISAKYAHAFLAINEPIISKVLVVEGHVPDFTLDSVKHIIKNNQDTLIFTTGIPLTQGSYLCGYTNYADLTAASLYALGIDSSLIISVPCHPKQRDRTFESAMALKRKLKKMNLNKGCFNVLTTDTHARRTKLLFEEAFGDSWKIGIISIHSTNYNNNKWWTSSYGMRAVVYEGLAWFYAKFLFYPDKSDIENN